MHYRKLVMSGFGPYTTEKEYTFPDGVIVITGPNGSGKTTITDAISWALYGPKAYLRSVKDRTSIINSNAQTAKVSLTVSSNETMIVTRSMTRSGGHKLKVTINGREQEGGVTASQEIINDFLGNVNASVFTHLTSLSSSPSQTVNPFISSNDRDRRAFLSELVDPEGDFEKTNKIVRDRLRDDRKEQTRLEGRLAGLWDNAPAEPNQDRLNQIENEIKDNERARRQQEQRMSATRSRDDTHTADLITTHKSDSELIAERITSMEVDLKRLQEDVVTSSDEITEISKNIEKLEKRLAKAVIATDDLNDEIDACDIRIEHHEKKISTLSRRRDLKMGQKVASEQLIEMSETSEDSCVLCGSPMTDQSHDHVHDLRETVSVLDIDIAKYDAVIEESEKTINQIDTYRDNLINRKDRISPRRIEEKIDTLRDRLDRRVKAQDDRLDEIERIKSDLERDTYAKKEHDDIVARLMKDVDPEVLSDQEKMNDTWTHISDFLADLYAERTLLENRISEWDEFQRKVSEVESDIHWMIKAIEVHEVLKSQTSPTGVISGMIAEVAESISASATVHLAETFDRNNEIEIISAVEEGDQTCRITIDDRDISTYSHGEQSRFISAILVALAETAQDTIGDWLPLMWDEPTMAVDIGISTEFLDMVGGADNRQAFILTRDDIPSDGVDHKIVLNKKNN